MMNAKDPSNPASIACASTAEAAAVEFSTGVMNTFLGGPFDPSEVALRAYAVAVKSSEMEKCPAATSPTATYNSDSDDNDDGGETMPWDRQGWIPRTKSGKQKTPNMVRNELQRYIDQCKADGSSSQTGIVQRMGLNYSSFGKFMNPKNYKDKWSATSNGTYWAGAKLLARLEHEKEIAKKTAQKLAGGKRKSGDAVDIVDSTKKTKTDDTPRKRTSAEIKQEAEELIRRINAVEDVNESVVYDTCPEVVNGIKSFLLRDGVNKAMLCSALGNINNNSMARFLSGKKQDQCGNVTYRAAYVFLEKLRILEGRPKSKARLRNEVANPTGVGLQYPFSLEVRHGRPTMYIVPNFAYFNGMR